MRTIPDISHHNTVDWSVFNPEILIQKCTESVNYIDPTFSNNKEEAKKRGIPFLAYHFARANDPIKESNWFLKNAGECDGYVLDAEDNQTREWCKKFLDSVSSTRKKPVILYCPVGNYKWKEPLDYPLWIMRYGPNDGKVHEDFPPNIGPWKDWTMWQYTSNGSIPGVKGRADLNLVKDDFLMKKEPMEKSFVEAVEKLVGKDYGENLNESEQKDAAEKLKEVKSKLDWCGQLELTNKRLLDNNETLAAQITSSNAEVEGMRKTVREYADKAGICEPELKTCKENLRVQTEKANGGLVEASFIDLLREMKNRIIKW